MRWRWAMSGWWLMTIPPGSGRRSSTPPSHAGTRVWCRAAGRNQTPHPDFLVAVDSC